MLHEKERPFDTVGFMKQVSQLELRLNLLTVQTLFNKGIEDTSVHLSNNNDIVAMCTL